MTGGALAANVLNYVFHFALSRRLGPVGYGELGTLLAIAVVVSVIGLTAGTLTMQETARFWAQHRDADIATFGKRAVRWSALLGAIVGAVTLAAAYPLARYLHIESPLAWLMLAVALALGIGANSARGAAQGGHRFAVYAASVVGESAVKLVVGFALVALGFGVGGAMCGVATGLGVGGAIAIAPLLAAARGASSSSSLIDERADRFRRPALQLTIIYAASTALLYVDLLFAKHALSGTDAGYYTAAGTLARVIPFGLGLLVPLVTPKAVAARHAQRGALAHLLAVTFGAALAGAIGALAVAQLWPGALIAVTFGKQFAPAAPLLRLYAIDTALMGLGTLGYSYLAGIGEYAVARWLVVTVIAEAGCMAWFGTTAVRLLAVAIVGNALVLPVVAAYVVRSLTHSPQAPAGPLAEGTPSSTNTPELPLP
ncbi:MAG TPA: oligosaccharide flippase family protein [Candidatus Eremiobacteraceae bacterium]|nr:oligosaccharide flippase family protein [Candidatus Eremiobacteraceae bacterium]